MARFKCHNCGKESSTLGSCPDCRVPLEKTCPVCGYGLDNCICTGGSTKEPKVKH